MTIARDSYQPIAGDELIGVSSTAMAWPVTFERRRTQEGHSRGEGIWQAHLVCDRCQQSVFCLSADLDTGAYVTMAWGLFSGLVRHIREAHCDGGGILLDK